MKLLYVVTGLEGGGAEKVVVELADQMLLQGHHVKIVYLKGEVVVRPTQSIEMIYLGLESLIHLKAALLKYRSVIQSFQPDVIHAHMVHANIFTRLSRLFVSVPRLICSAHSNNEGGKLRMLAYRLTNPLGEVLTNVSVNAALNFEQLGAVKSGQIQTVYNGIDLSRFEKSDIDSIQLRNECGVSTDTPVFIAIGRLHEAKDFPNLLQAFAELKAQRAFQKQPAKLLIVGDGELRSLIEQMIYALDLNLDIILLGRRTDVPQLLNMADFFVLSSKYEGLPTVVIEAMACQTFVIATDCGGSAEIMMNTGKMVPVEDHHALAQAMNEALELSLDSLRQNNEMARLIVEEKFSLTHSVQQWLEIYAAEK